MHMSGFSADAAGPFIVSAPGDNRDYSLDWTALVQEGETLSASDWSVAHGLVLGAVAVTGLVTTQWLSGGGDGMDYRVTNTVTTSQGRVFKRSFRVLVRSGI